MIQKKQELEEKLAQIKKEGEERSAQRIADKTGKKYLSISKTPISIEALALVPEETAIKSQTASIEKKQDKIAVVSVNPATPDAEQAIKDLETRGFEVSVFVVSPSGFQYILSFYKFVEKKAEQITGKVEIREKEEKISAEQLDTLEKIKIFLQKQEFLGSNAGAIFEIVLNAAMTNRASDIHFEPSESDTKLRFRIDGSLHDIFNFKKEFYPFIISRVKLLSKLKLNITTEPQDGRFTIRFFKKDVEVRVAIAPAQFGEVIVMRLLDPAAINLDLPALGLRDDDLAIIKKELKEPNGLILNTGPTGSGKTTTLYTFLKYAKNPEIKVITVEDPIEYHLEGIEQTQVNEESGYTFANGLKSMMRQDPDIILVGEIRDQETAEIGIQAALTGHLVFSTVHANSAAGAIPRLLDLNVKSVSIGPALNLIIGQRLVRRLCKECKISKPIDEELKNKIHGFIEKLPQRVDRKPYKNIEMFELKGCVTCNNTGYKGRVAIYELLKVGPEIEDLIIKQTGETVIHNFAVEHGMTTMQQDGVLKVISGITTFSEVEAVTGEINWE